MRGFLLGLVLAVAGMSGAWAQGVKEADPLTVEVSFWNGLAYKEQAGRYVVRGVVFDGANMPVTNPRGELWVVKVSPDSGANQDGFKTIFSVNIKDRERPVDGGGFAEIFSGFFPLVLDKDVRVFEAPDYAVSVRITKAEGAEAKTGP